MIDKNWLRGRVQLHNDPRDFWLRVNLNPVLALTVEMLGKHWTPAEEASSDR